MNTTQKALTVPALAIVLAAAGCAAGGGAAQRQAERAALDVQLQRTPLEVHQPKAAPVEARLALAAAPGAAGLSSAERDQIAAFATDFVRLGRGSVVISTPAGSVNAQTANLIAQEASRVLFASGVAFEKIAGGAYQANPQAAAPVILSFARFEAVAPTCAPWSSIDPRRTADNLPPERFGCAQNANLAAMIVDPGDFNGDRPETTRDAARVQVGVDKMRKGEIPQVSGAVAGGGGQ